MKQEKRRTSSVRVLGFSLISLISISIVCVLALAFLVVFMQDRNSVIASEKLVGSELQRRQKQMSVQLLDYAYWDEAVEKIVDTQDPAWIRDNFGEYLYSTTSMSEVQVFDPQDRRTLLIADGELVEDPPAAVMGTGEKALIDDALATEDNTEPVPVAGFVERDGEVFLAAALRMTTYEGENDISTDHVMTFARRVDADLLAEIAAANLIRNVRWSDSGGGLRDGAIDITWYGGDQGRQLVWRPDLPGTGMIPIMLAGLFVFVAVVMSIGLIFARRISQHGRQLADASVEADHANRMKSDFLASMSHELRTPLNAVIGFSELMRREHLGPIGNVKYLEYADDIHTSGKHLLSLVNGLLDLSKIEAGRYDLDRRAVEPAEVIAQSLKLVEHLAAEKNIAVSWDVESGAPSIWADERALRQILVNLLTNALKFTGPGGEVSCRAARSDGRKVEICVSDTGIGIKAENISQVLEPFFQVRSDDNRRTIGTGLCLPVAKKLADLMGGDLTIESEPGEGTTVRIVLPAAAMPQKEAGAARMIA